MKISIDLDDSLAENEICIHVKKITETVSRLVEKISTDGEAESADGFSSMITGRKEETVTFLKPQNIVRIYSLQKKVYAKAFDNDIEQDDYELSQRLYQIEELMKEEDFKKFIRISNTDIVNFDYLKNMDMSLNGNIVMNLTNGERVFVSRRYMKDIKAKLKIR
ncbi:MAG: LytTR family transcriptional regulator [Treponema sp.]|nr:LytTR family transcriptional regulator [Treponema sp.]